MNIFIICPVRKITKEQTKEVDDYIVELEQNGHYVHSYMNAINV